MPCQLLECIGILDHPRIVVRPEAAGAYWSVIVPLFQIMRVGLGP